MRIGKIVRAFLSHLTNCQVGKTLTIACRSANPACGGLADTNLRVFRFFTEQHALRFGEGKCRALKHDKIWESQHISVHVLPPSFESRRFRSNRSSDMDWSCRELVEYSAMEIEWSKNNERMRRERREESLVAFLWLCEWRSESWIERSNEWLANEVWKGMNSVWVKVVNKSLLWMFHPLLSSQKTIEER